MIALVGCAALLPVSVSLCELAFDNVLEFRDLERIPLSRVTESVGGESEVSGRVSLVGDKSLTGPKSGAICVYYHYLVERERYLATLPISPFAAFPSDTRLESRHCDPVRTRFGQNWLRQDSSSGLFQILHQEFESRSA